jgi:hypothetical protein
MATLHLWCWASFRNGTAAVLIQPQKAGRLCDCPATGLALLTTKPHRPAVQQSQAEALAY